MKNLLVLSMIALAALASCDSPSSRYYNQRVFVSNEDISAVSFTNTFKTIHISGTYEGMKFNATTEAYANAYHPTERLIDSLGVHDLHIGFFVKRGDMQLIKSSTEVAQR